MVPSVFQMLVLAWVAFAAYYTWTYYNTAIAAGETNPGAVLKALGRGIVFPLTVAVEWIVSVIKNFKEK